MTKTLTEQWREGKLPAGEYYVKDSNWLEIDGYYPENSWERGFVNHSKYEIEEVLAPVPDFNHFSQLVKKVEKLEQRLYDKDQGFVSVLNIVLRNIEREQSQRKLTDLELSIKSQVKGVLGYNGLVDSQKTEKKVVNSKTENRVCKLEQQLAIATKALEEITDLAGNNENGINDYGIVCCAQDTLQEMEGVK